MEIYLESTVLLWLSPLGSVSGVYPGGWWYGKYPIPRASAIARRRYTMASVVAIKVFRGSPQILRSLGPKILSSRLDMGAGRETFVIVGMTPAAYFAFLGLKATLGALGDAFSALEGSVE